MVMEQWGLLAKAGQSGSDDPVGDDSGEAKGEDASPLNGNSLAFHMPELID